MNVRTRLLIVLATVTAGACGGGGDPADPRDGAVAIYERTSVGAYALGQVELPTGTHTEAQTVIASSRSGFTTRTTTSLDADVWEHDLQFAGGGEFLSAARLFSGGTLLSTLQYSPAYLILPGNQATGSTSTSTSTVTIDGGTGTTYTKTSTVDGVESVTVPAGTFTALKVTSVISRSSGTTTTSVRWWGEGVGLVKSVGYDGPVASGTPTFTWTLLAYASSPP